MAEEASPQPTMANRVTSNFMKVKDMATTTFTKATTCGELNHRYYTLEDFTRCPEGPKRVVVIGCSGAGKSTVLNVMGGWKFVQSKTDHEKRWKEQDGVEPLFYAEASVNSVTQETSFANLNWFGDDSKQFVAIDTPGHDDTSGNNIEEQASRDHLRGLAADLHNKLKAMGHIHAIVIVHDGVTSNRLNPATYTILQMVDEKFSKQQIWSNVMIAYTKCNEHTNDWKGGLDKKKSELQAEIKKQITGCKVDVPVIALGGIVLEGEEASSSLGDFGKLWDFISKAEPIDTTELKPFEGDAWKKFESVIQARDAALARAAALDGYMQVMFKLSGLCAFFFFRSVMLPGWMSFLCLNISGVWDEIFVMIALLWVIGLEKSKYGVIMFYEKWIQPYAQPYLDKAFPSKEKAE